MELYKENKLTCDLHPDPDNWKLPAACRGARGTT